MRHFFTRSIPPFSRVLLVESGSRELFENCFRFLYQNYPEMTCDLVTCYGSAPKNFRPDQGAVYRVTDYPAGRSRQRLLQRTRRQRLQHCRHHLLGRAHHDQVEMDAGRAATRQGVRGE
jgi:hypothetical protein